jgi:hypothetical protein
MQTRYHDRGSCIALQLSALQIRMAGILCKSLHSPAPSFARIGTAGAETIPSGRLAADLASCIASKYVGLSPSKAIQHCRYWWR